jgi:hypothetical protein
MAYQQIANKEARQERKIKTSAIATDSPEKANKTATDNNKIGQMKKEAIEKQDPAIEAANINLVPGIVTGSSATTSGTSNSNPNTTATTKIGSLKLVTQKESTNANNSNENKKLTDNQNNIQIEIIKKLVDQLAC